MSRFPAVAAVIHKAITAGKPHDEIREALDRIADDGRSLTVETLRIELEGQPARSNGHHRSTTDQRVSDGLRLAAQLKERYGGTTDPPIALAEILAERKAINS